MNARLQTRPADVGLVDLEPESRRQQHPEGREHTHQPALLIGGLEHDHGQSDVGTILRGDALDHGDGSRQDQAPKVRVRFKEPCAAATFG